MSVTKKTQAGAAMVEFAIILPLLVLLVIGVCEFSYAFYHLNILNKSVQDGARYFSDPKQARNDIPTGDIDISSANPAVDKTQKLVEFGNTSGSGDALLPPNDGSGYNFPGNWLSVPTPNHIQLTVEYTHDFILGDLLNSLTFGAVPNTSYVLTASAVLRVE